jgi:hypothetical protein
MLLNPAGILTRLALGVARLPVADVSAVWTGAHRMVWMSETFMVRLSHACCGAYWNAGEVVTPLMVRLRRRRAVENSVK